MLVSVQPVHGCEWIRFCDWDGERVLEVVDILLYVHLFL